MSVGSNLTGTVAANTRSGNIVAGDLYEFLPKTGTVAFYSTGSAAGLEIDVSIGGVQRASGFIVPPTNRSPVRPDDRIVIGAGGRGQRIYVTLLNTTAGVLTYFLLFEIY